MESSTTFLYCELRREESILKSIASQLTSNFGKTSDQLIAADRAQGHCIRLLALRGLHDLLRSPVVNFPMPWRQR
ncbi:MAG: hypothetical protein P4L86_10725 [Mycobacterium sp.]|nr:hypothetical protein [Mycobacterium sp.]